MCSWKQAGFIMVLGLHYSWGHPFPFLKNSLFLYIWLCFVFAAAQAFSSCSEQGSSLVVVHRLLTAVASLVAEHGL